MRWLLTSLLDTWELPNLTTTTTSDIPNHLYLWWSDTPPLKSPKIALRRGAWCKIGELWWKWPMNQIDQQEPGITTTHTHFWPSWTLGQTRYGFFFPSLDPKALHSVSPYFTWTAPEVPPVPPEFHRYWDSFDPAGPPGPYWDILLTGPGSVYQAGSALHCHPTALNVQAGVVTHDPHNLTFSYLIAYAQCLNLTRICITLSPHYTNDTNPFSLPDHYTFMLELSTTRCIVFRLLDGVQTAPYAGGWRYHENPLAIEIENGNIHFYEDTVLRASEVMPFSATSLYIYLWSWASGLGYGDNRFPNFLQRAAWSS